MLQFLGEEIPPPKKNIVGNMVISSKKQQMVLGGFRLPKCKDFEF